MTMFAGILIGILLVGTIAIVVLCGVVLSSAMRLSRTTKSLRAHFKLCAYSASNGTGRLVGRLRDLHAALDSHWGTMGSRLRGIWREVGSVRATWHEPLIHRNQ